VNVLITGSAGFVGSALVSQLRALGHRTFGIDRRTDLQSDFALRHDLCRPLPEQALSQVAAFAPEVCVHLASEVGGFLFNASARPLPELQAAIDASVIALCNHCRCERLVFTSTINVFETSGAFEHGPVPALDQRSAYAIAKADAEQRLAAAFPDITILRPTNIYGRGQPRSHATYGESHVIPDLLHKLNSARELEVFGDGSQRRNFVHVSDVCRFIAGRLSARGVCFANLRSELTLSIGELAHQLMRHCARERPVRYLPQHMHNELFALPDFDLQPALAQGWAPRIHNLAEGLSISALTSR
jgi:UDP-glucose 4-epimerase